MSEKPKPKTILDVVAAAFRDAVLPIAADLEVGRIRQIDARNLRYMVEAFYRNLQKYAEQARLPMTYNFEGTELVELTGRGTSPPYTAEEYENHKTQVIWIREHPEDFVDGGESALEALTSAIELYEKYMEKSARLRAGLPSIDLG